MYRQGDILFKQIDGFKTTKVHEKETAVDGRYVIAHGEATGHAHTVEADDVILYLSPDGKRVIVSDKGAVVLHQEHAPVTLPPGTYEIIRQREYSPEAIRNVAD